MTAILVWVGLAFIAWQAVLAIRWFVTLGHDAIRHDGKVPRSDAETWYRHEVRRYRRTDDE